MTIAISIVQQTDDIIISLAIVANIEKVILFDCQRIRHAEILFINMFGSILMNARKDRRANDYDLSQVAWLVPLLTHINTMRVEAGDHQPHTDRWMRTNLSNKITLTIAIFLILGDSAQLFFYSLACQFDSDG